MRRFLDPVLSIGSFALLFFRICLLFSSSECSSVVEETLRSCDSEAWDTLSGVVDVLFRAVDGEEGGEGVRGVSLTSSSLALS